MKTKSLVSLSGVGVHRNGRWILRGVDLQLRLGEIVTLVGPNGSGKSTCAKLASGILKPDEGMVSRQPDFILGYMPQKLFIDWTLPLSVLRFMKLVHVSNRSEYLEALERTGVLHLANSEMGTLSGGELQRVLLARAIAKKPDLLILDEPVQGVDVAGEVSLYRLIREVRDETGCAVLMVSHDLHLVMAETDRVICLNGHVCCEGSPVSVASSPEYRELFGDRASGALAIYQHEHDHTHLADGRVRHADGSVTDHCHPHDGHHHEHE